MQLLSLLCSTLFLSSVLAIPLDTTYLKGDKVMDASDDWVKEHKNTAQLDSGVAKANENLNKMTTVLDNHTEQKNKDLIVASFGQDAYDNHLDDIKSNVAKIKGANVKTRVATGSGGAFDEGAHGVTNMDPTTTGYSPANVAYGKDFYKKTTDDDTRAAIILHEASHYAANTGDHVDTTDPNKYKVLPGDKDQVTGNTYVQGYSQDFTRPKSIADLNKDTGYTALRDKTENMHQNAESYAIFGSLCGANARRALERRDYKAFHEIVRRQGGSCKLPPDYFKKKAAAKAAAATKAATSPTAGAKGKLLSTTKASAAGKATTAGTKGKLLSTSKTDAATKAGAKGRLPSTSKTPASMKAGAKGRLPSTSKTPASMKAGGKGRLLSTTKASAAGRKATGKVASTKLSTNAKTKAGLTSKKVPAKGTIPKGGAGAGKVKGSKVSNLAKTGKSFTKQTGTAKRPATGSMRGGTTKKLAKQGSAAGKQAQRGGVTKQTAKQRGGATKPPTKQGGAAKQKGGTVKAQPARQAAKAPKQAVTPAKVTKQKQQQPSKPRKQVAPLPTLLPNKVAGPPKAAKKGK